MVEQRERDRIGEGEGYIANEIPPSELARQPARMLGSHGIGVSVKGDDADGRRAASRGFAPATAAARDELSQTRRDAGDARPGCAGELAEGILNGVDADLQLRGDARVVGNRFPTAHSPVSIF
jgi:hypothetical protein